MTDILYSVIERLQYFLAVILAILVVLIYEHYKARERKRIQKDIAKAKENVLSKGSWFCVRYSSETRFCKLFKLVSWEASGILFISDTDIIFFWKGPQKIHELRFDPKDAVTWIGRDFWRNGVFSWVVIDRGKKYYFTSETGIFPLGSEDTTRKIYDALIKVGS